MSHAPKRRPWPVILPWLVTGAILVATAVAAFWPREAELRNPTTPGREGALIWGDGVFSNALELKAWLRARGVSYKQWALKHPEGVALIAPSPEDAARTARRPAAPPPPPADTSTSLTSSRTLVILGLLALLGGILGLVASRFASSRRPNLHMGVFSSAASGVVSGLVVGVAVALLLL